MLKCCLSHYQLLFQETRRSNTSGTINICLKLTVKTPPELRQWRRSRVFIANFEQISHIVLLFKIVDFEQVNPG